MFDKILWLLRNTDLAYMMLHRKSYRTDCWVCWINVHIKTIVIYILYHYLNYHTLSILTFWRVVRMCLSCSLVCVCVCKLMCTSAALRSHPVITKFGTQRRGLTAYVLSQEEMIKRHYPVRGKCPSIRPSTGKLGEMWSFWNRKLYRGCVSFTGCINCYWRSV